MRYKSASFNFQDLFYLAIIAFFFIVDVKGFLDLLIASFFSNLIIILIVLLSNVVFLELLVKEAAGIGNLVTFLQFAVIATGKRYSNHNK